MFTKKYFVQFGCSSSQACSTALFSVPVAVGAVALKATNSVGTSVGKAFNNKYESNDARAKFIIISN